MKIYHDIIQGTEAWHKLRYGKIGGSTSKGLFVASDTLLYELVSAHLEPFELDEDGYINADMQRGIELEPLARERLEQYTGVKFNVPGWMESVLIPLIGISPDGISQDETVSCEIKCPSAKTHTKTLLEDAIPATNIHQCLHYFTVNSKLQRHYFLSFRPESKHEMFVKLLTPDSLIDLGTKAKPNVKKIGEWANIARAEAMKLDAQKIEAIKQLEKI